LWALGLRRRSFSEGVRSPATYFNNEVPHKEIMKTRHARRSLPYHFTI